MNNNGQLYPQGAYNCRIISQQLGEASTGTPQFSFRFEVLESGEEKTCYMPLTDKTMDFAVEGLRSIGFNKNSLRYLDPNVTGFHDFTGQEVEMYCKHDNYNGKTNEKWRISSPRGEARPVADNKLRELDNLFGRAMKSAGGGAAPASRPAPPRVPVTPDGITDDDVPF